MASKTKKTEMIRARKKASSGTRRKAANRTKGTTKTSKVLFGD